VKRLVAALLLVASPALSQSNGWRELANGWGEIQTPPGYSTFPAPATCTTPGQLGVFLGSDLKLGCVTGLGFATSTLTVPGAVVSTGTISGLVPAAEVTATGTVALTSTSAHYQFVEPNGSDRDVTLPVAATGMAFVISHVGVANVITVKNSAGTTQTTVAAGEVKTLIYSGTAWRVL